MCGVRPFRRTLLLVGLVEFVITQTGCMSYTQIQPTDAWLYDEVRIEWVTGERENLWYPNTVADTLVAVRASGDTLYASLEEIDEISVGYSDGGKTAALVGGVIALGVAISVAAFALSDFCALDC
jgi:hypothetical protein